MVILQLNKQPTIVQAIFCGDIDELYNYLNIQHEINYEDRERRTPLHAAAFRGDAQMVEVLLIGGAKINAKDNKWLTPLHRACRSGCDKALEVLLRHKAEPLARNRHWQTPIHLAAANDSLDCLKQLAQVITELNIRDRQGRTPLHYAAYQGHTEIVKFLIEKGSVVNARDCHDNTPLHLAVLTGQMETVEILVRHRTDLEARENKLYTALNIACALGHEKIVHFLLESGATAATQNNFGNTPLHTACLNGHVNVCKELLEKGASLEAVNNRNQTPLHIAIVSERAHECLEYLMKLNVNVNSKCILDRTALHAAVAYGRIQYFKNFLQKGAWIHAKDKNGSTILHYAAVYGHSQLLSELIKMENMDVNLPRYDGMTALHMACALGHASCCSLLLEADANLEITDKTGKTAVHLAVLGGGMACLEILVGYGAKIWALDNEQRNVIHYAALLADFDCLMYLDGFQFPLNCQDIYGCTPLHLASAADANGSCIRFFLRRNADIKLCDKNGRTCFHYAAANGNHKIISKLFQAFGLSLNAIYQPNKKVTPLHLAAKHGHWESLEELLEQLTCCIDSQTDKGTTALMLACKEGHVKCVQLLLDNCADVTVRDRNGMTALHHCAKHGRTECLKLFIKNRAIADGALLDCPDSKKRTALMWAVMGNHNDCVEILLKGLANPNCIDENKFTALYKAICLGNTKIVELLLLFGANTKIRDKSGKAVIHVAAACGNFKCLELLVKHLDPEYVRSTDSGGFTILHWVASKGNYCCLKYLLEENLFQDLNGHEFSPLHCAGSAEFADCLELILKHYNTNRNLVNLRDHLGRTVLLIIARHGNVECLNVILKYDVTVDELDYNKKNCIMVASKYGHRAFIGIVLQQKKFNVMLQDSKGNSALHYACMGKHIHCALDLLNHVDKVEDLDVANNLGKTCLHLATQNGLVEVVDELIRKGASITKLDKAGMPPILYSSSNFKSAQCMNIILNKYSKMEEQRPQISLPTDEVPWPKENSEGSVSTKNIISSIGSSEKVEESPQKNPPVTKIVQTDITLVRNPDKFECEQIFNLKRHPLPKSDKRLFASKIGLLGKQKSYSRYDSDSNISLSLHKSTSDISIVKNNTYGLEVYNKIVKNLSSVSAHARLGRYSKTHLDKISPDHNKSINEQHSSQTNVRDPPNVQYSLQQLKEMRRKVHDLKKEIRNMNRLGKGSIPVTQQQSGIVPKVQKTDIGIEPDVKNSEVYETVDGDDSNKKEDLNLGMSTKCSLDLVKESLDLSLQKLELAKLKSFLNDIVSRDENLSAGKDVVTCWTSDRETTSGSDSDTGLVSALDNKRKFEENSDDDGEDSDVKILGKEFKRLHIDQQVEDDGSSSPPLQGNLSFDKNDREDDQEEEDSSSTEDKGFLARSPTFLSIPGVNALGQSLRDSEQGEDNPSNESLNEKLTKLSVMHNEVIDSRNFAANIEEQQQQEDIVTENKESENSMVEILNESPEESLVKKACGVESGQQISEGVNEKQIIGEGDVLEKCEMKDDVVTEDCEVEVTEPKVAEITVSLAQVTINSNDLEKEAEKSPPNAPPDAAIELKKDAPIVTSKEVVSVTENFVKENTENGVKDGVLEKDSKSFKLPRSKKEKSLLVKATSVTNVQQVIRKCSPILRKKNSTKLIKSSEEIADDLLTQTSTDQMKRNKVVCNVS